MKPHLKDSSDLFRPSFRDRVDWMAHWVISRSDLMRRRFVDSDLQASPGSALEPRPQIARRSAH